MEQATTTIEEFMEKVCTTAEGVKLYIPVEVKVRNGDKKMVNNSKQSLTLENFQELHEKKETIVNGKPWYLNKTNCKENQDLPPITYKNCTHYEINLRVNENLYCIDIDDETKPKEELWESLPDILKTLPYTLSSRKKLWHFYFYMKDIDNKALKKAIKKLDSDNLTFCDGEFLSSATWEKKGNEVFNFTGDVPTLSWLNIKEFIKPKDLKKIEDSQIPHDDDAKNKATEVIKETPKKLTEAEDTLMRKKEKLRDLVKCFNRDRISTYSEFRDFTFVIQNEFPDDEGVDIWDEISKQFKNYDSAGNMKIWNSLKKGCNRDTKKLTMGTLLYWAKQDNENLYNEKFNNNFINWDRLTEAEYARQMLEQFLGEKVIFSGSEMEGFVYNGVYWEELGFHNAEIQKDYFRKLFDFYVNEFKKVKEFYSQGEQKERYSKILTLDSYVTRKNIIKIISTEKFEKDIKWNQNGDLFAFNDRIYDLSKGMFIEPNPNQYINVTCGYSYGDIEEKCEEAKEEIKTFLKQILNDDDVEAWLFRVLASFLKQENQEEKAHFWLGEGRNGKGTLTSLLKNALGNYFGELRLEYYTNYDKRAFAQKNILFNCRHSRLLNTSEIGEDINDPNKAQRFITNKFKSITGGDQILARQNRMNNQVEFRAGKVLIQTNMMPELINIEDPKNVSLRERIVILKLKYCFTDDEHLLNSNPEKYKKKVTTLKEKFNSVIFRKAFISLLFEKYKDYLKEGIIEPEKVKKWKFDYFDNSNKVLRWFESMLKPCPDEELESCQRLNVSNELFSSYMTSSNVKMTKSSFREKLEHIVGKLSQNKGKRGLSNTGGVHQLQGYEWINPPEKEDQIEEN